MVRDRVRCRNGPSSTLRYVPSLHDHLHAPLFTDAEGEPLGESVVSRVGGTWVKAGAPRWKAYLFYLIAIAGGIGLIMTAPNGFDLFAMFGVFCLAVGLFGGAEAVRNKPFTRIFGGPTKPE